MRFISTQGYYSGPIDLNEHLINDPTATFILRVAGDSMVGCGIFDGDELIVDRSITPVEGSVIIAVVDGELLIRRLRFSNSGKPELHAENKSFPTIRLSEAGELEVWGVVTRSLHRV